MPKNWTLLSFHHFRTLDHVSLATLQEMNKWTFVSTSSSHKGERTECMSIPLASRLTLVGSLALTTRHEHMLTLIGTNLFHLVVVWSVEGEELLIRCLNAWTVNFLDVHGVNSHMSWELERLRWEIKFARMQAPLIPIFQPWI